MLATVGIRKAFSKLIIECYDDIVSRLIDYFVRWSPLFDSFVDLLCLIHRWSHLLVCHEANGRWKLNFKYKFKASLLSFASFLGSVWVFCLHMSENSTDMCTFGVSVWSPSSSSRVHTTFTSNSNLVQCLNSIIVNSLSSTEAIMCGD